MPDPSPGLLTPPDPTIRLKLAAATLALAVGAALMLVKFQAWRLTGSAAILSDALESIINVVAGGFALWSVLLSSRPPDPEHPYGHGKIEFFSAGFEGGLIVIAGLGILWEGAGKLVSPAPLASLDVGLSLLLGASAVNGLLGLGLLRAGRRTNSLTLVADGKHVLTDVWTSVGVIAGLALAWVTGWHWLDGAAACLVGLHILRTGWGLTRHAFAGLMDESDPALLAEIAETLRQRRQPTWIDVHRLRAWRSGARAHIDFHLILPGDMPLREAHAIVKELEALFLERFGPETEALIHLDPCEEIDCPVCENGDCPERIDAFQKTRDWSMEAMREDKPQTEKTPKTRNAG